MYLQNFRPISLFLRLWQDCKVYYCHWSENGNFSPPSVFLADSLPFHAWRFPCLGQLLLRMPKKLEKKICLAIPTLHFYSLHIVIKCKIVEIGQLTVASETILHWMIKLFFIFIFSQVLTQTFESWNNFYRSFWIMPKKVYFDLGPDLVSSTS